MITILNFIVVISCVVSSQQLYLQESNLYQDVFCLHELYEYNMHFVVMYV